VRGGLGAVEGHAVLVGLPDRQLLEAWRGAGGAAHRQREDGDHLLAPAVIRLLGNLHLTDRVNKSLALPDKHINFPQLGLNLFGFVSLRCHT